MTDVNTAYSSHFFSHSQIAPPQAAADDYSLFSVFFFVLTFHSIRLDYFCGIALENPTSPLICNTQVRWCSMIACSQKKVVIFFFNPSCRNSVARPILDNASSSFSKREAAAGKGLM